MQKDKYQDMKHQVLIDVEEAVEELRAGSILIVTDNEDRENEGDFIMAAEKVTPQAVNFIITVGRGLLCQAITLQRAWELNLPFMVNDNTSVHSTAFTVSVDAKEGTTTGISAFDRARTIHTLIDPASRPEDLLRPGHVFPLIAREGGLLTRKGHTEATVDLCRLAGLYPSGILCEILDEDGHMARLPKLVQIAEQYQLKIITVERIVDWITNRQFKRGAVCVK
jgi:3,4-dihydroxy 2-butanone 4-phosphate synthase/GTP cyclohydrolase II